MAAYTLSVNRGLGIINNTNNYIPYEYIKDIYFTEVKNKDGTLVHYDRNKLFVYDKVKNGIVFNSCDKPQINGNTLRTNNNREVIVE